MYTKYFYVTDNLVLIMKMTEVFRLPRTTKYN